MTLDRTERLEQMLGHAEWITRLSRALAGSGADAEDVAQETWVEVLRAPLGSVADPRRWLRAIMLRRAAKLRRSEERRRRREQATAQQHEPVPSADDLTARVTMQRELTDAVLELDEPYRSTIVLRFFEQLDVDAIATRTGSPRNTVRSRLQRGLQLLRARLDGDGGRQRWLPGVLVLGGRQLASEAGTASIATAGLALCTMKKLTFVAAAIAVAVSITVALRWFDGPSPPPGSGLAAGTPAAANAVTSGATSAAVAAESADAGKAERAPAGAAPEAGTAADSAGEPTGELVVRVEWDDGAVAPGIHVYLMNFVPGASRALASLVSNAAGEARAQVAAGRVIVASDRGQGVKRLETEVVAGKRQQVVLRLPAGVDVVGTVRDAAGAPVAGAGIWLSSQLFAWCGGALVGESGADGAFSVRAVPKGQSIGAVAKGFSPSKLVDLDLVDTSKSLAHVALVLGEAGGAVAGRVVDEKGRPVAGAIVAVGVSTRHLALRANATFEEGWAPLRAMTGDDGRYAIEGLAPRQQPVDVFGRGFAYWHGTATIAAEQTTALDVALERGVTVSGTVTGEDGKPLAGAYVRCFPRAIETRHLQTGQYDYDSTFGCPFATADAEGRYRLYHAASPDLHLYAGPGGLRGNEAASWADEVLHAESGSVVEWNPKIDPGLQIRGIVRYRDGEPMDGVIVVLVEPGSNSQQSSYADEQGRFRFVRLQKKAFDLKVRVSDPPQGAPPVGAREVWPDSGEVELQASFDAPKQLQRGSVRGTISDVAQRLANPSALQVLLAREQGSFRPQSNLSGMSFHFKDVEPGRVRVIAMSGEDPILYGPWVDLQPGEQKDLGTLVTEPGGRLVVSVVRRPGTEEREPTVHLAPVGGGHGRRAVLSKSLAEVVIDNVVAGEYRLSSSGKGTASVHDVRCSIAAGAPATAVIELRAGVARDIIVEYGVAQRLAVVRVEDERGGVLFDFTPPRAIERPFRFRLGLPLGHLKIRVETESGGVAESAFEMTSLAADQPAVVVQAKQAP